MTNYFKKWTELLENVASMSFDEDGNLLVAGSGGGGGGLIPMGPWDCSTEEYPTDPEVGQFWWASVAGTIDGTDYELNDWLVYVADLTWKKIDNSDTVTSVEGRTGAVLLKDADISMDGKDILFSRFGVAIDWQDNPPGAPTEGQTYIVGDTPIGAWSGHPFTIATYRSGAWVFFTPKIGYTYYLTNRNYLIYYSATGWINMSTGILANLIQNFLSTFDNAVEGSKLWSKEVVEDILTDPPTPELEKKWLVQYPANGDWAGQDGKIAIHNGTSWQFITPKTTSVYAVKSNDYYYRSDGDKWIRTMADRNISQFWVSTDFGDDDVNDGGVNLPFKTLQRAVEVGGAITDYIEIIIDQSVGRDTTEPLSVPSGKLVSVMGTTWGYGDSSHAGINVNLVAGCLGCVMNNCVINNITGDTFTSIDTEECYIKGSITAIKLIYAWGTWIDTPTGAKVSGFYYNGTLGVWVHSDPLFITNSNDDNEVVVMGDLDTQNFEENTEDTTNSTSLVSAYSQAIELSEGVQYKISWQCELLGLGISSGFTENACRMELQLNGTPVVNCDQIGSSYCTRSGFFYYTPASSATYTFDFQFRRSTAGASTVGIRRKRICVEKVVDL